MELRDHVLIGALDLVSLALWILAIKWSATNGPFLIERPIVHKSLALLHRAAVPADDDKPVGILLLVAGPVTLGQQSPGRGKLLPASTRLRLAGAAAVGMIHRIAGNAAVNRTNAPVTGASGLAQDDILMLHVAHLANRGVADLIDLAIL